MHQPIAGSIPVLPEHRLVITEGNYLLAPDPAWHSVRGLLGEVWYCDLASDERGRRLVARHERFGKAPDDARTWVATVDEPNATAITSWRDTADLVVHLWNRPPEQPVSLAGDESLWGVWREHAVIR